MAEPSRRADPDQRTADAVAWLRAIAERRDEEAFAHLFETYAPRVKGLLRRSGSDGGRAEELAQEAMLTVWRKAHLYDPAKATPATWIFCIARNIRIDAIRRERRPEFDPDDPMLAADTGPAPDATFAAGQREARLREALRELPADQVRVLELSFFEGKAHGEIAAVLNVPLGTVKSRIRLAFGHLRAALEGRV
jgi:RNA polymerase sigma-70 factor (ECF subfamily)